MMMLTALVLLVLPMTLAALAMPMATNLRLLPRTAAADYGADV
jgi:hypothetical protein